MSYNQLLQRDDPIQRVLDQPYMKGETSIYQQRKNQLRNHTLTNMACEISDGNYEKEYLKLENKRLISIINELCRRISIWSEYLHKLKWDDLLNFEFGVSEIDQINLPQQKQSENQKILNEFLTKKDNQPLIELVKKLKMELYYEKENSMQMEKRLNQFQLHINQFRAQSELATSAYENQIGETRFKDIQRENIQKQNHYSKEQIDQIILNEQYKYHSGLRYLQDKDTKFYQNYQNIDEAIKNPIRNLQTRPLPKERPINYDYYFN